MPAPDDPAAPTPGLQAVGTGGDRPPVATEAPPAALTTQPGGAGSGGAGSDGDAGAAGEEGPAAKRSKHRSWIIEAVVIFAVAVVVAVLLRTFVVSTYFIPSGSMEPTLQIGDRILVDKLSYHLHAVHRGDIVVFARPPAEDCGGPTVNDLVKRVIGLPGETISLSDGRVDINGKPISEPWLPKGVYTGPGPPGSPTNLAKPYKIPPNDYFVMGDNRPQSCDSRYWGPVSRSLIVGRVIMRIWPLSGFKFF